MSDVATTLQEIKGIGPATRTAVLDKYPTLDSIDKASTDELEEIKGVGPATAKAIKAAVAKAEKETAGERSKRATKEAATKSRKAGRDAATSARKAGRSTSDATRKAAKDVSSAGRKAATEVSDAAQDTVEGTVVEFREGASKVGEQADNTVQQVKAALTSLQNVITASLDAGRESLPEAQRQLKAAGTSLRKLGPTIIEALEQLREERRND